jgi:hypothetical protein
MNRAPPLPKPIWGSDGRGLLAVAVVFVCCWLAAVQPAGAQQVTADARDTLAQFMDARISRDDRLWQDLMTQDLLAATRSGSVTAPTGQISNPCWYRYEVLAFTQPAPDTVAARVRIYEHFWPGDVGGSLPSSFAQEVGLARATDGWKVSQLGPAQDERVEPNEPHGPTTSACYAGRRPGVWLVAAARLPVTGRRAGSQNYPVLVLAVSAITAATGMTVLLMRICQPPRLKRLGMS